MRYSNSSFKNEKIWSDHVKILFIRNIHKGGKKGSYIQSFYFHFLMHSYLFWTVAKLLFVYSMSNPMIIANISKLYMLLLLFNSLNHFKLGG